MASLILLKMLTSCLLLLQAEPLPHRIYPRQVAKHLSYSALFVLHTGRCSARNPSALDHRLGVVTVNIVNIRELQQRSAMLGDISRAVSITGESYRGARRRTCRPVARRAA
jgi:hypothetical protein